MSEEDKIISLIKAEGYPRLTITGGFVDKKDYQMFVHPHKIEELTLYELSIILMEMIKELTNFWDWQIKNAVDSKNE